MKKYVRAVLDDLKSKAGKKQNPAVPTPVVPTPVVPTPVVPQDLENQMLSKDPQQKVRQLDYQAQKDQERETLS